MSGIRMMLATVMVASVGMVVGASPASADFAPDIFDAATPGTTGVFAEDFSGTAGTGRGGGPTRGPPAPPGWGISTTAQTSGNSGLIPVATGPFIWHEDSDGGSPTLTSPSIDLTAATDPYLTLDVHSYLAAGDEGNQGFDTDKSLLQVNVVTAGGSTRVFELSDTDRNGADGWLPFTIRLADFAGQSVQLEFVYVDGDNVAHDIAIDNVEIVDVPAPDGSDVIREIASATYFLPISSSDVSIAHTHLHSNVVCGTNVGPQDTVTEYTSIVIADTPLDAAGEPTSALVMYDHVEDGFGPANRRTQASTELWGDGDPSNGFAPGHPEDLLFPGEVIILETVNDPGIALQDDGAGGTEPAVSGAEIVGHISTQQYDLNYDAGDRLTSPTGLVISRAAWNDGSSTLLAGAVEVSDTSSWGTVYELPIGEDLSSSGLVPNSFEYVGASIMARTNGTVVTYPGGSVTLDAGESFFVDGGLNVGDQITSSGGSISVNVIAGETCSNFQGRWYRIDPVRLFDSLYFTPVGPDFSTDGDGNPQLEGGTSVVLYNPGTSSITIEVFDEAGFDASLTVPAGGSAEHFLTDDGSGASFASTGDEPFYAVQLYDTSNTARDWGFALLGLDQLSPIVQAGLAVGVDPTSGDGSNINSPIWLTSIWNGPGDPFAAPGLTICVDWNGDGGALSIAGDASLQYDVALSGALVGHLDDTILDEGENPPSNDLTGTKVFVCNPDNPTDPNLSNWLLAAAWGQDASGSFASPSIDVGTVIFNLPTFTMDKELVLIEDDNNNGITDVGDSVRYALTVTNTSGVVIPAGRLKVWDNLPIELDYLEGTTVLTFPDTTSAPVPDDVGGVTAYPLDDGDSSNLEFDDPNDEFTDTVDDGVWYERLLLGGESFTITFDAEILSVPPNNLVINTALVTDGRAVQTDQVAFEIPEFVTIGNRVWLDEDGDGVQDAGEDGIAGVQVTLTYVDGDGTPVELTTITDIDGGYVFGDLPVLPDGEAYNVSIDPPDGMDATFDEDGTADNATTLLSDPLTQDPTGALQIQPGEEHLSTDFGLNWVPSTNTDDGTGVGAIGDRVWVDSDGDGVQDNGEAGLSDVTVNLFTDPDGDGVYDNLVASTTTDASGNYVFDDLPAGVYEVVVDPATLPGGLSITYDRDGDLDGASGPIVLAPGDVYVNADFGYQPSDGSPLDTFVGDTVWLDADGDGVVDAGEPPFAGVSVVLLDASGDVVATALTDALGQYSFVGAAPGDYTVWGNDSRNITGEYEPISEPDGTLDLMVDVALAAGQTIDTVDFGLAPPDADPAEGLVGDTVFLDRDGSGTPDPGEGIEGVRLELFDEFDRLVGVTFTNELGLYAFGDLVATIDGVYTVRVDETTLPAGLSQSVDPDGDLDGAAFTQLADDEQVLTLDFGYVADEPVSLSGTLWEDLDADGVLDADEPGRFANVTISLVQLVDETFTVTDPDTQQPIEITAQVERVVGLVATDADGNYSFDDLAPGEYEIYVIDNNNVLGGYWHSDAPVPGTDGQSQNDEGYPVTLVAGSDDTTGDFGYYLDPGAVGDTVFEDSNANGVQDPGEPGIEGALVQLEITYPDGTVLTLVEPTDANGNYLFDGLLLDEDYNGNTATAGAPEPSFVVSVVDLPAAYVDAVSTDPLSPVQTDSTVIGGSVASDGDADDPAGEPAFPGQAETDVTNDFGFVTEAVIGDFVFEDVDGDGVQDAGEPGIGGVTVNLYDEAGDLVGTTVTSSDPATLGEYAFTGLLPGTYQVEFIAPDGLDFSDPDQGGDDTLDSDPDPLSGRTGDIVLSPGEVDDTVDAGLYDPVSIGDLVFNDANGSATYDGPTDDPGIAGVTVELYEDTTGDGTLDTLVATTVTSDGSTDVDGDGVNDPAGSYLFDGLAPGAYGVVVDETSAPLAGFGQTVDPDATLDGRTTTPIVLNSGESNTDQDFGYFSPATIGDFVFYDADDDGVQDPGEPGIDGVTVELVDDTGAVVQTAVTGTNGQPTGGYLFENVPAGTYTVRVVESTLPAGFDDADNTVDPDGNGDGETTLTVNEGDSILTVDFGYFDPGTIGDTVFHDVDGDGVQDPATEPGIGGVTVNLYLDDDGTPGLSAGDTQVGTTTTNIITGGYLFTDLPDGSYLVEVDTSTLPAQFQPGLNSADPDLAGSDKDNLGDSVSAVDLDSAGASLAAVSDLDQDFGYFIPSSIGDRVFEDVDGDGIDDGPTDDPGIAGVTVNLLDDTGTVIATTTTSDGTDGNPAGFYEFTNLAPGDYTVEVDETTLPAGSVQTFERAPIDDLDSSTDVTLGAGDDVDDVDFGYFRPSTIGDFVFDDLDGDGIQDPGEPGVAGVLVELLDDTGAVVDTVVTSDGTDGNPVGSYEFTDVVAGEYSVRFTAPVGRDFSPADQGGDDALDSDPMPDSDGDPSTETTAPFDVPPATDIDTVDAGLLPQGALGDFVWSDTDGDGIQDPGEPGIEGALVELLDAAGDPVVDLGGTPITTSTDAFGAYLFENLPTGEYRIRVTAPATDEWLVSPQNEGADDTVDSDIAEIASGVGLSDVVTVANALVDTLDAGFVPAASIGDFVFGDTDNDGIQDAGETGVPDVTVNLYADLSGDGTIDPNDPADLVATDVTDANGEYLFDGLRPDVYVVEFVNPDGTIFSPQDAFGNVVDAVDSDPDAAGLTDPITLAAGVDDDTVDAGLVDVSVIGDLVFDDLDGDGIQDPGEPGVPGVTVELLDSTGLVVDTVQTSDGTVDLDGDGTPEAEGVYLFTDVVSGDYTVRFTAPAGRIFSPADAGPDAIDSDPAPDGTVAITVVGGVDDLTIDAGLLPTGALGDFVWSDTDNDGIQDPGEPGIEGALVELLDAAGDPVLDIGGTPITDTTDSNGAYLFENLPAGDYRIQVTPPATDEWLVSPQNQGGDDAVDSDIDGSGLSDVVTVGTGLVDTLDAGFVPAASIGDFVFDDANNNGVQEPGEDGVPGVTVNLYADLSGDGTIDPTDPADFVGSDTTDGNGEYLFDGLAPGDYVVEFVAPDGTIFSPQDALGDVDDTVDSDADPNGVTDPITVVAGQDDDTVDAGLVPTGSIGDRVFNDVDGDGIQDAGEPGIGGVLVELLNPDGSPVLDDLGNPVTATTLTAPADLDGDGTDEAIGEYLFDDLAPGNYVVRFGDTDGTDTYLRSPADATADAVDSDADPATGETGVINIAPGEDDLTVDAGLVLPASITGTVLDDVNGDGSDLQPLPGVTVTLYRDLDGNGVVDDGVVGVPTTTGADGSYSFGDLLPGDYIVVETTPPGYIDVSDEDTTPDGDPFDGDTTVDDQIAVQLDQGETDDGNDFVDLDPAGSVTIEKTTNGQDADVAPGPLVAPSSDIDWTYTVTNTGNIPLNEVVVTDDQGVVVDCGGVTTLAVGQTIVCTGSGAAQAGQYTNIGSVSTLEGPNDSDPSNYFGVVADIAVDKTVALGTSATVDCSTVVTDSVSGTNGTDVTYCITVTNTGNVPLRDVAVNDPLLAFSTTIALLAPGESQTFVIDDQIDGDLTNVADATGTPIDVLTDPANPTDIPPSVAPAPSDEDDASVNETPTFEIQKDNDADGDGTFSDTERQPTTPAVVPFQVTITNTGGQDLTFVGIADVVDGAVRDFTDLACTDDAGTAISVGDTIIEGATVTCTFSALVDLSVDADEIDTITVVLADETGQVQQTDDSTVLAPFRAEIGGVVYEDVDGNGTQDPTDPGIADATVTLVPPAGVDLGAGPGVPIVLNVSDGTEDVDGDGNPDPAGTYYADELLPGDYTIDVTLPEPFAQFEDPDGVRDDSTTVSLPAGGSSLDNDFGYAQPTLDLEKSTNGADADDPTGPFVAVGDDITWTYTVTNTGVVPVTDVVVDDAPAPASGVSLVAASDVGADGVLSPGESWVFTATALATAGQFSNVADATGAWTDSTGAPQSVTSDEDPSHYYGIDAAIDVEKTVAAGNGADCATAGELVTGQNGDLVTYCFEVTNTGNTLLEDVTLTDADLGITLTDATFVGGTAPVAGQLDLAPGESATYSYDSSIDGDLVNTAEVSGTPVDDITDPGAPQAFPPSSGIEPPTATDTAAVEETPTFSVVKTNDANGDGTFSDVEQQTDSPDTEPFQIVITNDGAEPLTVVSITDSVDGVDRAFTDLACVDETGAPFDPATDQIGVLDANDSITCTFSFLVDLRDGSSETDTISVVLADDEGNEITETDTSVVNPPAAAELGGVVYEDLDGNGTQDPTDPGIGGAEVTVTPPADVDLGNGLGQPVVLPVSDGGDDVDGDGNPDPAGTYYLGDLLPGDYDVEVTLLPEAYQQIEDPDAVVDNATTVTLAAGDSSLDNDFGYAQPTLDIEKSTTTDLSGGPQDADDPIGPFATTGTTVTWTYEVTNTGSVAVTNVTISDVPAPNPAPALTGGDDGDGVLEPGETWIFTASGTAIAGQFENTAEADAEWTDSEGGTQPVTSDQDQSHYFGLDADIQIDKTVALGAGQDCPGVETVSGASGADVTYCFRIENTGNVILQDVTLTDADLGITLADAEYVSGVQPLAGVLTLAPGDVSVFRVDDTITGDLTNTATASGTPIDTFSNPGQPPQPFDPTVVPAPMDSDTANVDETPTFVVDKLNDANGDGTFADTEATQSAVSTVPFEVTITNEGVDPVVFTSITDTVGGTDVAMDALACAPVAVGEQLAGGASTVCTFERSVDVSVTGTETDVIEVVLSDLDGSDPTTETDDSTVTGLAELSIVKTFVSASDADADGSYDVVYTVVVANAGTTADVYDLSDEPQFDSDLVVTGGSAAVLSSGANTPATPAAFVPAAGTWPLASAQTIASGETHTYTLTFAVDASAVVAEPVLLDPCDPVDANPGEALFNEATLTSDAGALTAEACGEPPLPVIELDKAFVSAIDGDDDGIYDVVYTVVATNSGDENGSYIATDTPTFDPDVTITGGTATAESSAGNPISAPAPYVPADGTWPLATDLILEPGEAHTFTLTFTVDATNVLDDPAAFQPCADTPVAGEGLFNAATLTYGDVVRNDDACGNLPSLSIDKQDPVVSTDLDADGEADLGDTLTYTIIVSNTGATPLTGVTLVDTIIDAADITCVRADDSPFDHVAGDGLAIGESVTCTGTYVVQEADVIAGEIENTATADSNETPPADDTVTTPVPPAVTIVKTAGAPVSLGAGQFEITYTVTVGNTGSAGTYTLDDELQFGGGITIDSASVENTVPGTVATSATWDGQGDNTITDAATALGYEETHVYVVTVIATVDPAVATADDLLCPPPGSGTSSAFANTATVSMDDDTVSDDACVQPPAPDVEIAKTVTSGPTLLPDGTYEIVYQVVVSNVSNGVGVYDLTDELRFGGGIVVDSATMTRVASTDAADTGIDPVLATWTGLGDDTKAVEDEPVTAAEQHTYEVTVIADAIGLVSPEAGECSLAEPPSPGGFLNVATVTSGADVATDDDCRDVPLPGLSVTKIVSQDSPVAQADGTYEITYTIQVINTGDGPGNYDLADDLRFGDGIQVLSAVVTSTDVADDLSGWAGTGPIVSGVAITGDTTHTYTVVATAAVPATVTPAARDCQPDLNQPGTGFLNVAELFVGGELVDDGQACVQAPSPTITVTKTIPQDGLVLNDDGTFAVTYEVVVENTGPAAGQYELADEITFGAGITIDTAAITQTTPDGLATDPNWDGDLNQAITTAPVVLDGVDDQAGVRQHTYRIVVTGSIAGLVSEAAGDCTLDQGEDGTGFLNTATITVDGVETSDDACDPNPDPDVSIDKSTTSGPTLTVDGTYALEYQITVTNTGGFGTYDLADSVAFGGGISVVPGSTSVVNTAPGDGSVEGRAGWVGDVWDGVTNTAITAGQPIAAGSTQTFTVSLEAAIDPVVFDPQQDGTCPPPNTGGNGGFLNVATITVGDVDVSDDACVPPPSAELQITKTVTSGPTDLGDGTYSITYDIVVANNADGVDAYDLDDELRFGDGITIIDESLTNSQPGDIVVNGAWDGVTDTGVVTDQPILGQASHTYQVTVTVDALTVVSIEAAACGDDGTLERGGLLNIVSIDSTSLVGVDDACGETPLPDITVAKAVTEGPVEQAGNPGVYDITYDVVVTNAGAGSGRYDLTDDLQYGQGITVVSASVTSDDVTADLSGWTGSGTIITDQALAAGASHTYTVDATASMAAGTLPEARDCDLTDGEDGTGLLNIAGVSGPLVDPSEAEACEPLPEPDIDVSKTVVAGPTPAAGGAFDITYEIDVTNSGLGIGEYDLDDALDFGDGLTVVSASIDSSDVDVSGTAWNGTTTTDVIDDVALAGASAHTYTVTVRATVADGITPDARDCVVGQGEDGTGFLNTVTVTVTGVEVPATDTACDEVPDPNLTITKTVVDGPTLNNGEYVVRYDVTVRNTGQGPGTYDLVDDPSFGPAITIVGATVSSGDVTLPSPQQWAPAGGSNTIVSDVAIAAGGSHTYRVTLTTTIDPVSLDGTFGTCTGSHQSSESEFFNRADVVVDGTVVDQDDACVPPPTPNLVIEKTVDPTSLTPRADGIYDVVYSVVVRNTGTGPTTYELTDRFAFADAVAVLDVEVIESPAGATLVPGFNGDTRVDVANGSLAAGQSHTYRIAVTVDASGVRDEQQFDCDLDSGETGTGLLNRATVNPTAEACVPIPQLADLVLTKAVDQDVVDVGQNVTFTIFVTNTGPSDTSGVTVRDVLPTGLTYVSHSGGSFNPSNGIWTIGDIAVGEAATLDIVVRVDAERTITNIAQVWTSDVPDPDSTPGNSVASEDDQDDASVTGRPVVIVEPPAPPPVTLPRTGSESGGTISLALWTLLGGVALVAIAGRRRHRSQTV